MFLLYDCLHLRKPLRNVVLENRLTASCRVFCTRNWGNLDGKVSLDPIDAMLNIVVLFCLYQSVLCKRN